MRRHCFTGITLVLCLLMSACGLLRKKDKSPDAYISFMAAGKSYTYLYNTSGVYDTGRHVVTLKAYDTTLANARMMAIVFNLGDSLLGKMRMPHVCWPDNDVPTHQKHYASLMWDDGNTQGQMLENHTFRSWGNLRIVIEGYEKGYMTGSFSGPVFTGKRRVQLTRGMFRAKLTIK